MGIFLLHDKVFVGMRPWYVEILFCISCDGSCVCAHWCQVWYTEIDGPVLVCLVPAGSLLFLVPSLGLSEHPHTVGAVVSIPLLGRTLALWLNPVPVEFWLHQVRLHSRSLYLRQFLVCSILWMRGHEDSRSAPVRKEVQLPSFICA